MTRTVRTVRPMCGIIADMLRVLTGLTAWLAGSALAVGLAWFGADLVVRNTGMSLSAPVIGPGPTAPSGSAHPSGSAPVGPDPTARAASAPASATPLPSAAPPSPAASPSSAVPLSSASPISSATAGAGEGTARGYTLTGGRVTLLVTSGSAQLMTAVPMSGYSVQTWSGPGWLRVDFSSGPQVSSLIASWNGHPPSVVVEN